MIYAVLHRVFAVVRFVQLEWLAWCDENDLLIGRVAAPSISTPNDAPSVEAPIDDGLDAEERAVSNDIREMYSAREMTDQQVKNAAIGFVAARRKIQARNAKYAKSGVV